MKFQGSNLCLINKLSVSGKNCMQNEESGDKVCRALLIEDDEVDRRAIIRALKHHFIPIEYDAVRQFSDIDSLIKKNTYDIILTDMNLPDSNGLDTITSLLSMVEKTPIVVLSGNNDDALALESVHAGAQDYIPKQYIGDIELITRTLRHAMERHQLKMGLEATRDRERFLAHYDLCTSLPNRLLFLDRIHQAVSQGQRNQDKFFVFFIDLDRFKNINDTISHSAGDEVLWCVGQRMKALVRDSDTVARFGGDEFILLLQRSGDNEAMESLAERLIEAINKPIPFGHHLCSVGASIGIACYPQHGHTPEALVNNADTAMYEAKSNGRNQLQFFTQDLFDKKRHFSSLEKALREALESPSTCFELHYQPRVELITGKVYSVEALIRWTHKDLGNIPPDQFISLAEELGLIEHIDEWVLETACQKIVQWQITNKESTRIGVNISGRSFNRRHFVSDVVKPLLKKYNIDGCSLEMEMTESVLLTDTIQVNDRLKELKALGISLAIDDFGTGFSSLNYLNHFPIDTLKIDGSFICDHKSSRSEQAVLKAIVALGEALEMNIVAECIESDAQRDYLLSLRCNEGQGFYWSKPELDWTPNTSPDVLHQVGSKTTRQ